MSNVQQWAWSLCLVILICTVVQYIIPTGGMERSVRLVLGGFVVLGIITPITNLVQPDNWDFSWAAETAVTEDYIDQSNKVLLEQAKANVTVLVARELQAREVDYKNIEITMDTNADNCIVIDKAVVTIGVQDAADVEWIRETIGSALEIQTEVVIDDG